MYKVMKLVLGMTVTRASILYQPLATLPWSFESVFCCVDLISSSYGPKVLKKNTLVALKLYQFIYPARKRTLCS